MSPLKAGKPTAVEQEDTESRTDTGILLGPRPISFWGGGLSVILVMEEKGGFFERVGNTYLNYVEGQWVPGSTLKSSNDWGIEGSCWERRVIRLGWGFKIGSLEVYLICRSLILIIIQELVDSPIVPFLAQKVLRCWKYYVEYVLSYSSHLRAHQMKPLIIPRHIKCARLKY